MLEGSRGGFETYSEPLGIYQNNLWGARWTGSLPNGLRTIKMHTRGSVGSIRERENFDGPGIEAIWNVRIRDWSALVSHGKLDEGRVWWGVTYVAFGHRLSSVDFSVERRDYRL